MKQRTKAILDILKELYPDAKCELEHNSPFQLLVATILSAQTTDKKVNEVTETLFRDYPDLDAFLTLSIDELEERIENTYGFKILDHSVKFFGICANCCKKQKGE